MTHVMLKNAESLVSHVGQVPVRAKQRTKVTKFSSFLIIFPEKAPRVLNDAVELEKGGCEAKKRV
jgi:hypothetical protein